MPWNLIRSKLRIGFKFVSFPTVWVWCTLSKAFENIIRYDLGFTVLPPWVTKVRSSADRQESVVPWALYRWQHRRNLYRLIMYKLINLKKPNNLLPNNQLILVTSGSNGIGIYLEGIILDFLEFYVSSLLDVYLGNTLVVRNL